MSERQKAIAEALWTTLILAYKEGREPDDHVKMPVREAAGALLTCVANLLSQVPNAEERHKIIAMATPAIGKAVQERRSDSLHMPVSSIVLPR